MENNGLEYRGAHWVAADMIDCEIFLRGRWLPFTASPNDSEEFGKNLFAALAQELGPYQTENNEGPE